MLNIESIEDMVKKKTSINLDDVNRLVVETRRSVAEADEILIKARHNREMALNNYTRALTLRTRFIERSVENGTEI